MPSFTASQLTTIDAQSRVHEPFGHPCIHDTSFVYAWSILYHQVFEMLEMLTRPNSLALLPT